MSLPLMLNGDSLQGKTSLISGAKSSGYYGRAYFVICGSCFWCASDLCGGRVKECPACGSDMVESIPLAPREKYRFDLDDKRGMIIDFG